MSAEKLTIRLPSSHEEWETKRRGFVNIGATILYHGCVAAVDGFFQSCKCPGRNEVTNVRSYYSGHYESFGVNCQAACDASLAFIYFGIVAPGSTNDNIAFPWAEELYATVRDLPTGTYFVGDAAYPLLETLLIPFTGSQRDNVDNDAFNFYMSQLRIRIEMAFGRLVNKFRILKRPLETKLKKSSKITMACACLHNFVIDEDIPEEDSFNDNDDSHANAGAEIIAAPEGAPRGMAYLPTMPEEGFDVMDGVSQTRDAIVEAIHDLALRRPHHNLVRNNRILAIDEEGLELEFFHPE